MEPIGINGPLYESMRPSAGDSLERRIRQLQHKGPKTVEEKELMSAAQEFESFFMYLLIKEMRKTVDESKMFHGGRAEEIFRDMLDEEMAKEMAHTPGQGIGIAKMLYDQLSRNIIAKRLQEEDSLSASVEIESEQSVENDGE